MDVGHARHEAGDEFGRGKLADMRAVADVGKALEPRVGEAFERGRQFVEAADVADRFVLDEEDLVVRLGMLDQAVERGGEVVEAEAVVRQVGEDPEVARLEDVGDADRGARDVVVAQPGPVEPELVAEVARLLAGHRPLEDRGCDAGDREAGGVNAPRRVTGLGLGQRQRRDAVDHTDLDRIKAFRFAEVDCCVEVWAGLVGDDGVAGRLGRGRAHGRRIDQSLSATPRLTVGRRAGGRVTPARAP